MNDGNLVSIGDRTTNEQREITKKGGIKSGEIRRRNRDIKKIVAALLQAAPDAATAERLQAMGFDDRDITNKTVMVLSLFEAVKGGNVKAFETLMKYAGEDPDEQRKELEMQMKRDRHIMELNKQDYTGSYYFLNSSREREQQYALNDIKNKYKELKEAKDAIIREEVEAALCDDDDDYNDEE